MIEGELLGLVDSCLSRDKPVALAVGVTGPTTTTSVCAGVRALGGESVNGSTQFRVASISKVVTTVLLLRLSQRGLVDLDAPANEYLTAFQLTGPGEDATVRELLGHTAGLGLIRGRSDLSMRRTFGPLSVAHPVVDPSAYYAPMLRVGGTAGTIWSYGNHAHSVAGQLAADVTGTPFHALVRQEVIAPLGMVDSGYFRTDNLATGYNQLRRGGYKVSPQRRFVAAPAGEFVCTIDDLLRLAQALVRNDDAFLDGTHRSMMAFPETLRSGEAVPFSSVGFRLRHLGSQVVSVHGGRFCGYSSFLIADFENERAAVAMSSGIKLTKVRAVTEEAFTNAGWSTSQPCVEHQNSPPSVVPPSGHYRLRRAGLIANLHGLVATGGCLRISNKGESFTIHSPMGMFASGGRATRYGSIAGRYLYARRKGRPDELQVVEKDGRVTIWLLPALLIFDRCDMPPANLMRCLFVFHRVRNLLRIGLGRVLAGARREGS